MKLFKKLIDDFKDNPSINLLEEIKLTLKNKCSLDKVSDFVDALDKAPESEEARAKAIKVLESNGVSCFNIKKFFENLNNKDKNTYLF